MLAQAPLARSTWSRHVLARTTSLALVALLFTPRATAQWPAGFSSTPVATTWQQPTGLTFAPDGRLFVIEKAGLVWLVQNGVKSSQPVIDISEEVGNWGDYGLLAFALDPSFLTNGRIYLGYVVDYHYLSTFGTPAYDPATNVYHHDTIARVTRYTLDVNSATLDLVPGSRRILIGESMTTGIPLCFQSHGMGSLVFGADGTLFVSAGDGASFNQVDTGGPVPGSSNTALADGIIRPKEDIGAFRAQLVDSLSGKILRIDPETGDGLPTNPWFDSASPRAPRSRVWALGLRNPFRITLQPGTGSSDPAFGQPGTLWIGDVGWGRWEEVDVCASPGLNYGWPLFEGLELQVLYPPHTTWNQDAPNPLFGTGGCVQPYFAFGELIAQVTTGTPSFPNPCDTAQQVPAGVPHFVHERPLVDWYHGITGPARTGIFQGTQAAEIEIGAAGSPIGGTSFGGFCSVGGTWYSGTDFPPEFRGSYYFADYVNGWINRIAFDAQGTPTSVEVFGQGGEVSGVVSVVADPVGGGLYYIRYADFGGPAEVRHVVHAPDILPVAHIGATPAYGPAPLAVSFVGSNSTDPQGHGLTYLWEFGDGTTSNHANLTHVFQASSDITAQGTIIGRVFELTPPGTTGNGNSDPEVIRDGDMPPPGTLDVDRQYDTYHGGDQGNFDWIGYSFATPQTFTAIVFQDGQHRPTGGWFNQVRVQVGDGTNWSLVPGVMTTPAYAGLSLPDFTTYHFEFAPVSGTHIRLAGVPGGNSHYVSIGELRVHALDPALLGQPVRRDVRLTVRDSLNHPGTTTTIVSLNNTPPDVHITSPIDGSTYPISATTTPVLSASVTDLEHGPAQLACAWQTTLHHDEHVHPEPIDTACATTTTLPPIGCDGPTYFYDIALTVTDAAGLSGQDRVYVYPDCVPVSVCAGDGSGLACPCGNTGAAGHGCENSFGTGGGKLDATGTARLSADSLLLSASDLPPSTSVLFFQGDTLVGNGNGSVFGDGLRCCGGTVVRLALRQAVNGVIALGPPAGDAPLSAGLSEQGVRYYQVWYRNTGAFCSSAVFNLTNALRITWIP